MKFIFRKGKVPIKVFAKNEHKPKQRSIDSIVEGDDGADEIMHPDLFEQLVSEPPVALCPLCNKPLDPQNTHVVMKNGKPINIHKTCPE